MKRVTIIGGGISGLSTAHYVKKFAAERGLSISIELIESSEHLGGKIQTHCIDGFIIESGPNGFLSNKSSTLQLCSELGLKGELYPSSDSSRRRYIARGGKLLKVPDRALEFFSSPILSFRGKLRLLSEPFIPPGRNLERESLFDFSVRRLGVEAAEWLIEPMAAGIFAGDPKKMSLKSSFPKIYRLEREFGGLFRGMLALRKKRSHSEGGGGPAGPGGKLYSLREGMSSIISGLQKELEDYIKLKTSLLSVEKRGGRFLLHLKDDRGEFSQETDILVLSVPAYSIAGILSENFRELSEQFSQIRYAPLAVIAFGFKFSGGEFDSFGFLVPAVEGGTILGALFDSSVFQNRAPKDRKLVRVMMGGMRSPRLLERGDNYLIKEALSELSRYLKVKFQPELVRVFRHLKAIPQYDLNHPNRLERIEKLRPEGLFFNNNCLYGVGVNDCTANALKVAKEIVELTA